MLTIATVLLPLAICTRVHEIGIKCTDLIPAEQISGVDFGIYIGKVVVPTVGDDHGCAGLETGKVMGDFAALEVGLVQRGFVDEHGNAIGFELLHHVLDGGLTEIVGTGLHGQPVDADNRVLNVLDAFHHFGSHEFFACAVRVHNGFDKVLRHLIVVGKKLLGVLRQAIAAIAEAGIVVAIADAWVKTYAVDDFTGIQSAAFRIGVQFVEICHTKR